MSTLLLRLSAPLQAWGMDSKFEVRGTAKEPTKSGVIGLLACALGRKRGESLDDLRSLRFGVRIDKEGEIITDFQIAKGLKDIQKKFFNYKDYLNEENPKKIETYVTSRDYLCDAVFLVGLESPDLVKLREIENALKNPAFPLFLGRRSCPPTEPFVLGIKEGSLEVELTQAPWQVSDWYREKCKRQRKNDELRVFIDADACSDENNIGSALVKDDPVSFSPFNRESTYRRVVYKVVPNRELVFETEHDPLQELSE